MVEQKCKNIFLLVCRKSLNELLQTQPPMNPFGSWTKNQINNSLWKNGKKNLTAVVFNFVAAVQEQDNIKIQLKLKMDFSCP